jgi:hypothetical protein
MQIVTDIINLEELKKELAGERWNKLSIIEQMTNIGCDVDRAICLRNEGKLDYSRNAFNRAIELLDFTIADPKNKKRWNELCPLKDHLIDYFVYDNKYATSDEWFQKYFSYFSHIHRSQKGK